MPQPNEVRCTECRGILFKVEGRYIIQVTGGRMIRFEPVGSVTTRCKCNKINVFVPQPAKSVLAIAR